MIKPCRYILTLLLLYLGTFYAHAQLCSGSLGDPVVSIDFGSGTSTHGSALGSGVTSYTYSSNDFPSDGYYTIENSTAGSGSVWWSTTDHTGNSGGYMMVVNASYSVTDYFYKNTVTGLCPNTTYEFAAWVVNLLRSQDNSPPNITFSIETTSGTVLNSYTTGSIPLTSGSAVWKQFGFYFTTPANVSDVVIRMRNNSAGGAPANDLAIDDITFRPCGPTLTAAFASNSSTTLETCSGLGKQFVLSGASINSSYSSPAYQWQVYSGSSWTDISGATSLTYTLTAPTTAGTYKYRMVSAEAANIGSSACEVASNTVTLTVDDTPTITTSASVVACVGDALKLTASTTSSSSVTYLWSGPNGFSSTSQNPSISSLALTDSGTYTVTLTTSVGCTATSSVHVSVNSYPVVTVSSAATICQGSSTTLTATGGGTYSWSPTTGLSSSTVATPVASPTDSTTYTVTVTNASGCSSKATVTVNVIKSATANAGATKKITQGESVTLSSTAGGTGITYYWTPTTYLSSSTVLSPVATPPVDITYTLHVLNACGEATSSVFVRVYKKIDIPNTFTPNADNINDVWNITNLSTYPEATVNVYNRFGTPVFSCTGYASAWNGTINGKPIPDGTYYYVIDLKYGKIYSGWVVIKH